MNIQYNDFEEHTSTSAEPNAYTVYLGGSTSTFDNINISKNTFHSLGNAIFGANPSPLSGEVIADNVFDGTINSVARTGSATVNIGQAGNLQFTGNLVENLNSDGTVQIGVIDGSVTGTFQGNARYIVLALGR